MSMGKRPRKGGEEYDAFSVWRRLLGYDRRPAKMSGIKKRVLRRERRQARQQGFDE